ncbi:esterase-like activity of phytase family protein [Streptomyces flaveolus]|uniref:esterase-like activity of phytase family protein n=1 Tax=Streptomyces flaveolus TaxID=67297 RepID=UPI003417369A
MALVSQGKDVRALALADNSPGRGWPVTLGSPSKLDPVPDKSVPLLRADGTKFPIDGDWYDGEGMVIEKGGRTMLIASDTGPAIRRFDIATGRQAGKDLPIPKELRFWPQGAAQTGRSIESLLSVAHAQNVTALTSLWHQPPKIFAADELVVDLATCPVGGRGQVAVPASSAQYPLLDNVEGMALGTPWTSGRYKGWHPLYPVSDDNDSDDQITRLYSLAGKLRP